MKPKKEKYPEEFNSILEVFQYFNSEKKAIKYLHWRRWQGNPVCPHCMYTKICCFSDGIRFKCKGCKRQFTGKVGTIFESSKVSLRKWFIAIFLVISHKKGTSAHQMRKHLKVSYKTAWFMLHRIRHLLGIENSQDKPLTGVIEADETFVGGKNKNRHWKKRCKKCTGRDWKDKTPILGLVETGGKARTIVMPDTTSKSMRPLLLNNIKRNSILVTDEYNVYRSMAGYVSHEFVEHRLGRYINDCGFSTNTIEGFWTWIKRMIMGVYHNVSRKYLQYYAHEATFRYNTRHMTDGERMVYALSVCNGALKHKNLTGKHG